MGPTAALPDAAARRGWVTVSVMLATVMQALDTTIANVALPHMQGAMGATQEQIAWVLTSYIVAAAIGMPLTGWLAARIGRKRLFIIAVIGFTVASMLCGAAQSLGQIVLFRLLQGAFGACLVPLSQAVLLDSYPREKHGAAMALWGVGVMVGPILGPALGGWLTEDYNWRWVFYINLPFGLLAWWGLAAFVEETAIDRNRRFDLAGFVLLSLAIGGLQLTLDRGSSLGWFESPEVVAEALTVGLLLYLVTMHWLTAAHPFIELGIFRDRNFCIGLGFIFVVGVILFATLALLPPFLHQLLGYPVLDVGLLLAPRGIGTMAAMMTVGRLGGRVDLRWLIGLGLLLTAGSLGAMAGFTHEVDAQRIVTTGVVQGVGLGFIFVPLSTLTFSTLAPRYRNDGTALFSLMRNIGSSIGISAVTAYLAYSLQANHAALAAGLTPFDVALGRAVDAGAFDTSNAAGLLRLDAEVNRQAALLAYLQDFRLMMGFALAALPLLLLLRPARASTQGAGAVSSLTE